MLRKLVARMLKLFTASLILFSYIIISMVQRNYFQICIHLNFQIFQEIIRTFCALKIIPPNDGASSDVADENFKSTEIRRRELIILKTIMAYSKDFRKDFLQEDYYKSGLVDIGQFQGAFRDPNTVYYSGVSTKVAVTGRSNHPGRKMQSLSIHT